MITRGINRKLRSVLTSVVLFCCLSFDSMADPLVGGGTGSGLAILQKLGEAYSKSETGFDLKVLPSLGSGGAIKGVSGKSVDIGVIARPLKDEELRQGLQAFFMARTPLVLVTNRTGEKQISVNQLENIFSGKITRWVDNEPIRLVLRPISDTDTELLGTLSPNLKNAIAVANTREGMIYASTDQESASSLEKLPGSLGTMTLGQLTTEGRRLRALVIDSHSPTMGGKPDPNYPLYKTLYIVVRQESKQEAFRFVRFIRSNEGRRILDANGFSSEER